MTLDIAQQILAIHEVANIFPMMSDEEYKALVADIRSNGLQQPIWTYQGKIIDGRNRYKACREAGVEPIFQEWDGKGSLVAFTISLNVKRRHLTSSQLAAISIEVEKQIAKENPVGRPSQDNGNYGNISVVSGESRKQAADLLGTNAHYVTDVKKIAEKAPELIDDIKDGTLTVPDAKAIAEMPQKRRKAVVEKAKAKKDEEGKRVSKAVKEAIIEEKIEQEREEIKRLYLSDAKPILSIEAPRTIQRGQTWKLGRHTLYCGDSASQQFIDICSKSFASFAFADPPYNAGVAEWDTDFLWKHDYLMEVAPIVAVTPGISAIQDFMRTTEMPYKWSMSYWLDNGMTRGALGFGNWIYVALFAFAVSLYRNGQDFERISVVGSDRDELDHKGRKPLSMMRHLISLFTEEGQTTIDPFLGTGSTLIVCEETNRVCVGAELNTDYCESIIRRWERQTGLIAEMERELVSQW